jgi:hypothetical protein
VAKEGRDVNTFTVIKSHKNHHAIIDQHGEILGYRFRINVTTLTMTANYEASIAMTGQP